ncbi:MAG: hypothetical protein KBF96_01185 [Ignavibacteria bacterium]|jgi:hypothetical protein|nr:hypothetical protein [Ignavibacteria bacterium]
MMKQFLLILFFSFLFVNVSFSQVELVQPRHPVYDYLQRMQTMKILKDYNRGNIPLSREKVASFLQIINEKSGSISSVDRQILGDLKLEFEYEMFGTLKQAAPLFEEGFKNIFSQNKQKYLYSFADSNATLFFDGLGELSQRESRGDSIGRHSITLGELGFRVRGTLYDNVGYYLRASNGQKLAGDSGDVTFARNTDPKLFAQNKFQFEQRNYDTFDGYLRFRAKDEWLAITVGRSPVYQGFGFIDRLYLSDNTVAFDYLRLDLGYKAVRYSFMYGSLKGDSLGRPIGSKNIATHRLDVSLGDAFRMGFFESVTIADNPFSFTFLNPISFLTSAELNKATQSGPQNNNNSIMGLDAMVFPVKNLAIQGSMLIDDLEFSTLFKDNENITNKFGFQFGLQWAKAFTLPDMDLKAEYTYLDPFVYTHVSNKTMYTHWDLHLGHHLDPNSDEIAFKLNYNFTNRINLNILYQYQRSANGIVTDSAGRVLVNYGGNINNATGYSYSNPEFLVGNRINRSIITTNFTWEFVKQFYIQFQYVHRAIDNIYQNISFTDDYGFATFRVDY